jgi:serine/threonine protein kinase
VPTLLTSRDWIRLQEIFNAAVELHGDERSNYLDRACAETADMRHRVESLIASFEAETKLGELVGAAASQTLDVALPTLGGRIGPYRITAILGRGGMGVVYRATRDDAEYEKDVAVKVAAINLLTSDFRQRFLSERQILANLDHPHIARLLDGGTTSEGLPFVVMEYVPGKPIDVYCADAGLDRRSRVRLMVAVAGAVDYAHRHLVVHRDLKPDNILVTAAGEPKLLDFGIAKALDLEAKGFAGVQTIDGTRLMTPDYASPEQVRGQAITTATDTYQLGILLYQLLTGSRPFKPTASMGELERAICESVPPKPRLDSDLDRILLHALEKEPSRRYASAGALQDDLERYLNGYAVRARPPSWSYLTAKFARRHRLGVAAASLFLLLLTSFAVGMAIFARRASQQARIANDTTAFLLGLFEANDPEQGRGDEITARELLDKGANHLNDSADRDPVVQVRLLDSMGTIYNALGHRIRRKRCSRSL